MEEFQYYLPNIDPDLELDMQLVTHRQIGNLIIYREQQYKYIRI